MRSADRVSLRCERPFVRGGLPFPCWRCAECRVAKAERWARKLEAELIASYGQTGEVSSFVTSTYGGEHAPPGGSLRRRDVVLALKRLRKAVEKRCGLKFRAAYCGEYGTQFGRPHYHFLLFGLDPLKFGDLIRSSWGLGHVQVLPAEPGSCEYLTKDMAKSLRRDDPRLAGREPSFLQGPCGFIGPGSKVRGGAGAALARRVGLAQVETARDVARVADRGDVVGEFRVGGRVVRMDRTLMRHAREAAGVDAQKASAAVAEEFSRRCRDEVSELGYDDWRAALTDVQGNLGRAARRKIFSRGGSL